MSDHDLVGDAWLLPASRYAKKRAATHASEVALFSQYVAMRDGCRLALDVYLPRPLSEAGSNDNAEKFPTIVIFTPYTRRFHSLDSEVEISPNTARYTSFFPRFGYAVVVVDIRGTGASFGTRIALRSPQERDDAGEIAQWIVEQPWSDGQLASTGISYLGAAACFFASTGHPAIKAIAPLFAVSDIYSEQLFPGGMSSNVWSRDYDTLMVSLDNNDRAALTRFAYFGDSRLIGPMPVDEDPDGRLLAMAIAEHRNNFRLHDMMPELAFRGEGLLHDPGLNTDACSPFSYLKQGIRPDLPVYSISGWYDGGGYANGAISRFLSLAGKHDRLLLGPWDHGARINVSPWRAHSGSDFMMLYELLRFFDEHVLGKDTGLSQEAPIHYYCIHAQRWLTAQSWPPVSSTQRYYLKAGRSMGTQADLVPDSDAYQVRFDTTTGQNTRWERLGARDVETYYADWNERTDNMLNYVSDVFDRDTELSGHIVVSLSFESSQEDAALFIYASEFETDGSLRYMTEGMLRALHRRVAEAPPEYASTWPWRRFHRADAERLRPGAAETAHFALLPISWCLKKGSRLCLSVAGADVDHFPQVPHGRPPRLTLRFGGDTGSFLELPVRQMPAAS